jgi:hypothetical protein
LGNTTGKITFSMLLRTHRTASKDSSAHGNQQLAMHPFTCPKREKSDGGISNKYRGYGAGSIGLSLKNSTERLVICRRALSVASLIFNRFQGHQMLPFGQRREYLGDVMHGVEFAPFLRTLIQ